MSKDLNQKRSYRKSPGRQYQYEHDPLHSQEEDSRYPSSSRLHSQRPDPRRTRQLLRQNILNGKTRSLTDSLIEEPTQHNERSRRIYPKQDYDGEQYAFDPAQRRYTMAAVEDDQMDVDPDAGYEVDPDEQISVTPVAKRTRQLAPGRGRPVQERDDLYEDDDEYEYLDEPPRKSKRKLSRRGLLVGLGGAAVVATGAAAYTLGPKLPQAMNNVGSNIQQQVTDAFNKGVAQGADNVRKEFAEALANLEGFSLDGAINAARLTRVAYDVFVSPILKFGSAISTDFLKTMLSAFKTARGWLAGAYQDNATLQAIQKVLESWVEFAATMPKQLDAVTQSDLDGAQAYLRALQRKIADEKAKLKNPQPTPGSSQSTPAAQPSPTQKTQ
jgi:hypothetical protein